MIDSRNTSGPSNSRPDRSKAERSAPNREAERTAPTREAERAAPATEPEHSRGATVETNYTEPTDVVSLSPQAETEPVESSRVSSILDGLNGDSDLWDVSSGSHEAWDTDGDGHLTEAELQEAAEAEDLTPDQTAALFTLQGRQGQLAEYDVPESFADIEGLSGEPIPQGISLADLRAASRREDADTVRLEEQFAIEQAIATGELPTREGADPAALTELVGTRDYYLERYADFRTRNPQQQAPDYYLDYGLRYFDRFQETRQHTSERGTEVIDNIGVALQQAMETGIARGPEAFAALERDPRAFQNFAYDSHPDAYLEGGIGSLGLLDQLAIARTPEAEDLLSIRGIRQILQTAHGVQLEGARTEDFWNNYVAP